MADRTTHAAEEPAPANGGTGLETELARGRRGETPFLLVGSTVVALGAVVVVLAGVLLLVWWLS